MALSIARRACVIDRGRGVTRAAHKHRCLCRKHLPFRPRAQPDVDRGKGGLDPSLEIAVPFDQRPVNELANLKQTFLYSWGTLSTNQYVSRLAIIFAVTFALLGAPIAYQTYDPMDQPLEFLLSASAGSLLVEAAVVIRVYLGWAYVSKRLLSATVEYEETGWYDGQVFVKPPEVLMRDRLLGTYEVKPVLGRLKSTLVGSGAVLLLTSLFLVGVLKVDPQGAEGARPSPKQIMADGVVYSSEVKDLRDLINDDRLAQEEAAAQRGIPGYCGDRLLRAYAGGQYCKKFDR